MEAASDDTKVAVAERREGDMNLDQFEKERAEKLAALATSSQISPEVMKQYEARKITVSFVSASR